MTLECSFMHNQEFVLERAMARSGGAGLPVRVLLSALFVGASCGKVSGMTVLLCYSNSSRDS